MTDNMALLIGELWLRDGRVVYIVCPAPWTADAARPGWCCNNDRFHFAPIEDEV